MPAQGSRPGLGTATCTPLCSRLTLTRAGLNLEETLPNCSPVMTAIPLLLSAASGDTEEDPVLILLALLGGPDIVALEGSEMF
jgi:hypothetical protein